MRRYLLFTALCATSFFYAQTALKNYGTMQIHEGGEIGFHTNLINDGTLNQNLGLAGFYNTVQSLSISGTNIPRFHNFEVAVDDNLLLNINTEVSNNLSFISGHVITPRNTPTIALDFVNEAFNVLEANTRHTDGYASFTGNNVFEFPIGDDNKLRPLITPVQTNSPKFSAAYFNEDPNTPTTFSINFNTNTFDDNLNKVSIDEFWDFDGNIPTTVILTWDEQSNITNLVTNLDNLRVVGWNKTTNKWENLGNINTTGNLNTGTISSDVFIADNYEIITFGSYNVNVIGETETNLIINNLFSPNGDDRNDTFVIEGAELIDNVLEIYNRWGNLVYKTSNYRNEWGGIANVNNVLKRQELLPAATYYYVFKDLEGDKTYTGWLYINY